MLSKIQLGGFWVYFRSKTNEEEKKTFSENKSQKSFLKKISTLVNFDISQKNLTLLRLKAEGATPAELCLGDRGGPQQGKK